MKLAIDSMLFGKNTELSGLAALMMVAMIALGCACGDRLGKAKEREESTPASEKTLDTEETTVPAEYIGFWTGADDTTITIRRDGGADYKSARTSVSGGSLTLDRNARTRKITLLRFGPTFTIDQPPSNNEMTLSGVLYKKDGGFADNAPADVPSREEAEKLLKNAVTQIKNGVDTGKFTDFYAITSEEWKRSYTAEQTDAIFAPILKKKDLIKSSLDDAMDKHPNLSNGPKLETFASRKVLVIDGEFPSAPYAVRFETRYLWQEGRWKVTRFKIDLSNG